MSVEKRFASRVIFKAIPVIAIGCWSTASNAALPAVGSGTVLLHLKADAANMSLGAGNEVLQWNDLAGTNHFSQANAARQPIWVDNVLGGKPVIRFTQDILGTGTGLNIANRTPFSFFAVTTSTTDPFSLFDSAPQVQNPFRFGAFGAGFPTPNFAVEFWDRSPGVPLTLNSTGSVIAVTGTRNVTNNRVLTAREFSADGQVVNSATGNTANVIFGGTGNPKIGTINNGVGNFFFSGDVAEIILYSGEMTANDISAVETYLKNEYTIVETPIVSATPSALGNYGNTVLAAQPVAFWRLETNDTPPTDSANAPGFPQQGPQNGIYQDMRIQDLSQPGPRPTDTIGGQPLLGFAADNKAPKFRGNAAGGNDVALFPDDGNLNMSPGATFTLEAWVKGTTVAQEAGAAIIAKGNGGGNEQFAIDVVNNAFRFFAWNGGNPNTPSVAQSTVLVNPNEWQHVVGAFDASEGLMKLYVNGVEVASAAAPATIVNNLHDISVGARQSSANPPYDHNFDGKIDEVAVYGYALSPAEIRAHFDAAFVVPEPSSMLAGVLGAALLSARRRRTARH